MFGLKYYAHRGLHSKKVKENTMESFEAAKKEGFGIELDVHLTSDNRIVVFHDYNLERLVGVDKSISNIDSNNLNLYKLKDTSQSIVLLDDVFDFIGSEVPIIVEVKSLFNLNYMANEIIRLNKKHKGEVAFKSFNHDFMDKLKVCDSRVYCGKVFSKKFSDTPTSQQLSIINNKNYFNFDKMDLISVSYDELPFGIVSSAKKKKMVVMSWTIKNKHLAELALKRADSIMFENFIPVY